MNLLVARLMNWRNLAAVYVRRVNVPPPPRIMIVGFEIFRLVGIMSFFFLRYRLSLHA